MNIVGSGNHRYEPIPGWEQLPSGWSFYEAVGVACDSRDRVYVFNRGEHPMIVFDSDGQFLNAWGEGQFARPHGIWISEDDTLYLSDDMDHTVKMYSTDGELLWQMGTSGQSSDTGIDGMDYRSIQQPGGPFNMPTNVSIAADGSLFVSDGYGNCRIHKFTPTGELLMSWGEPGDGPGQFNLPHGIFVDKNDRVLVADRENDRIQIFSTEGEFITQWRDIVRPCNIFVDDNKSVFVTEVGKRAGMFPWQEREPDPIGGRVSIFDGDGNLLSRWGGGLNPGTPGDFYAPHDIWVDSHGSIYVGEVTMSAGGKHGHVPADTPTFHKFARKK